MMGAVARMRPAQGVGTPTLPQQCRNHYKLHVQDIVVYAVPAHIPPPYIAPSVGRQISLREVGTAAPNTIVLPVDK